jgi:hypothetical protein
MRLLHVVTLSNSCTNWLVQNLCKLAITHLKHFDYTTRENCSPKHCLMFREGAKLVVQGAHAADMAWHKLVHQSNHCNCHNEEIIYTSL